MIPLYVQLGRAGDILNLLPFLRDEAQRDGCAPRLMVSRDYAELLEAAPYVEPIVFEGPAYELESACAQAETLNPNYVCTQVNGNAATVEALVYARAGLKTAVTTSFAKEQWRVAKKLHLWDQGLPLLLTRSPQREEALLAKHWPKKSKRVVLVAPQGNSSPFPYRELLIELLKHSGYGLLDLSEIKAERLVDLCGLYERALALVAIDSAPLHLAAAVPGLPVLALANDKPLLWNGSPWRPQHFWYCRYHDFPERAVEMVRAIRDLAAAPAAPEGQRLIHVWSEYESKRTLPRLGTAWVPTPIYPGACGLDSAMKFGGGSRSPRLRDAIRMGLQRARAQDWVFLTRPDTQIDETRLCLDGPAYAYRLNLRAGKLEYLPIVDLFGASKEWWLEHLNELPEVYLGKDFFWSQALWALFRRHGAEDITGCVSRQSAPPANHPEPAKGSTLHNLNTAHSFVAGQKVFARYPKVSEQLDCVRVIGLNGDGYNPSIIEHAGQKLLAYRYHPQPAEPWTRIALAGLVDGFKVSDNFTLPLEGASNEDPKLFTIGGKLCLSWVNSTWPAMPPKSVVRWGALREGRILDMQQPTFGKNDFSSMEKNWVFWDYEGSALVLYQCSPEQTIFPPSPSAVMVSPAPAWAYGPIKGGTPPVPFGDKWIRFFHSTLDNEFGNYRRRYFLGAQVMQPRPPFETVVVSRRPIACGSEVDDLKVRARPAHWKANVIFPGGAIPQSGGGWMVALGVNDCECVLARITEQQLNL